MLVREISPSMNSVAVAKIDARLTDIRRDHGVTIPLAIESGSRAWGFPSPDSDYDCRFIFVRPVDDYLSPWPPRDVIETPLESVLDVNGWDLGKALKLLLKGNAVVIEWLTSPIIYGADQQFRDEFLALSRRVANRSLIGQHYLHLGQRQRRTYFGDGQEVPQKKVFYALRPAAALRWLRHHPDEAVAPMHFPLLLKECDPPSDVAEIVLELISRKALSRELGSVPLPAPIATFIDSEFEVASDTFEKPARSVLAYGRQQAEEFFVATVRRFNEKH